MSHIGENVRCVERSRTQSLTPIQNVKWEESPKSRTMNLMGRVEGKVVRKREREEEGKTEGGE